MSCKYSEALADKKVRDRIENNQLEKQFAIECFDSFMEDMQFGKDVYSRDDMQRAYVNGWTSGIYHFDNKSSPIHGKREVKGGSDGGIIKTRKTHYLYEKVAHK